MCIFQGPKQQQAPAAPPPPPTVPNSKNKETQQALSGAREKQRLQAASAKGTEDTILTSPFGDTTQANTKKKTLLGT